VYEFTNQRKLCARCFINYFQKKALYTLRKFGMIKNKDIVVYENKGDFRGVVLEDILKMFSEKRDIKLVKNKSNKPTKVAIPNTIDIEADKFVHSLIKGHAEEFKELKPIKGKIIKPLYLFLDEEVLLYAKLRRLKFRKIKEKKGEISEFINELEKKHPEIKRAIVNSYLELY